MCYAFGIVALACAHDRILATAAGSDQQHSVMSTMIVAQYVQDLNWVYLVGWKIDQRWLLTDHGAAVAAIAKMSKVRYVHVGFGWSAWVRTIPADPFHRAAHQNKRIRKHS